MSPLALSTCWCSTPFRAPKRGRQRTHNIFPKNTFPHLFSTHTIHAQQALTGHVRLQTCMQSLTQDVSTFLLCVCGQTSTADEGFLIKCEGFSSLGSGIIKGVTWMITWQKKTSHTPLPKTLSYGTDAQNQWNRSHLWQFPQIEGHLTTTSRQELHLSKTSACFVV